MTCAEERQFGDVVPGLTYIDRPGVYALVTREDLLLVVETPVGYFLPGGGTDAGESPEDALHRELREEAGLVVEGVAEVGTARQYVVDSATGIGYNKIETYFRVAAVVEHSQPAEPDHAARWVTISDALAGLREPAQAWAVRTALL